MILLGIPVYACSIPSIPVIQGLLLLGATPGAAVAYMIAVKRTSLLFGILYGALWFGERGLARHLVAGVFMLGGIALISL